MDKDKIFSILQSLKEMNLKNSMHKLEEESGVYFNLDYFQDLFMAGQWVELESYLSSFTTFHESSDIFSEILLHKHRDAVKSFDEELLRKLCKDQPTAKVTELENTDDRRRLLILRYNDTLEGRTQSLDKLIEWITMDPNLREKLHFPPVPPPPVVAQVGVAAGPLVAQVDVADVAQVDVADVAQVDVVAVPLVAQVDVVDVAQVDVVDGTLVAQVDVVAGPLVAQVDVVDVAQVDVVAGPLVAQVDVADVAQVAVVDIAQVDVVVGPLVAHVDVAAVPPPPPAAVVVAARRRSRRVLRGVLIAAVRPLPAAARRRRNPRIRVDAAGAL